MLCIMMCASALSELVSEESSYLCLMCYLKVSSLLYVLYLAHWVIYSKLLHELVVYLDDPFASYGVAEQCSLH